MLHCSPWLGIRTSLTGFLGNIDESTQLGGSYRLVVAN